MYDDTRCNWAAISLCIYAMHAGTNLWACVHAGIDLCMQAPTSSSGVVSKIRHAAYMEKGRISGRSKGLSPTTWLPKALCGRSRFVGIWLGPCLGGHAASRFHPPCCHRNTSLHKNSRSLKKQVATFAHVFCYVSRALENCHLLKFDSKACGNRW